MKKVFYTSKNKAIFISVLITLSLLLSGGMFIYFTTINRIFESVFLIIIFVVGLVLFNNSYESGVFDRVIINERGIISKRIFKTVASSSWDNIENIQHIRGDSKIRIKSTEDISGKAYTIFLDDRDNVIYLLNAYNDKAKLSSGELKIAHNLVREEAVDYTSKLDSYQGKHVFNIDNWQLRIAWIIIYFITALAIVFSVYEAFVINLHSGNLLQKVLINTLLCGGWLFWVRMIHRKIYINENGVTIRNRTTSTERSFRWDEIKTIGVGVNSYGMQTSSDFLYLSTKELNEDLVLNQYFESEDLIVVWFRPRIAHCILKYWSKEIKNLDNQTSWQEYVNRLR